MVLRVSKWLSPCLLAISILLICVTIIFVSFLHDNQQQTSKTNFQRQPEPSIIDISRRGQENSIKHIRALLRAIIQMLRENETRQEWRQTENYNAQTGQTKSLETLEDEIRLVKEEIHVLISRHAESRNISQKPSESQAPPVMMPSGPVLTLSQQQNQSSRMGAAAIDYENDDYPSLILKSRAREARFHKSRGKEPDPVISGRLDCFNTSTCILIKHQRSGRSGNRVMQLRKVEAMLARCSGGSISAKEVQDDVVRFPTMQIFGKPSCLPAWDRLGDMEHILGLLQGSCQVFNFSWPGKYRGINCPLKSPPAFYRVHLDSRFPSWLEISLEAWATPVSNDTAVLHFRGGDIFSTDRNRLYTQPVCDHYLKSFRHAGAVCAVLLAEDDANPCVAAVQAGLNCTHRPARCGPLCAFTLLARARLVVASFSTFLSSALDSFSGVERRVYSAYCSKCPQRRGDRTNICTEINRTELFPWDASARQLEILRTRPASVVQC